MPSLRAKLITPLGLCIFISVLWVFGCVAIAFLLRADEAWHQPNSIGDFLAGMFAPLAFSWLVLAVFLQNKELQAQRDQLRQNGVALDLQAQELNRSVGELEKQTQILQQSAMLTSESIRIQSVAHYRLAFAREVMAVLASYVEVIEKVTEDAKIDSLRSGVIKMAHFTEMGNYSSFFFIYSDVLHEIFSEDSRTKWKSLDRDELHSLHWFFGNTQSLFHDYFKQWNSIPGERLGDMTELHILGTNEFLEGAVESTRFVREQSSPRG